MKIAELTAGVESFPSLRATGVGAPGVTVSLSRKAGADGVTEETIFSQPIMLT